MPNTSGHHYALTTLCPLKSTSGLADSPATMIRRLLDDTPTNHGSPMAKVPNVYFSRFFVLDDVVFEGAPAESEHLASKYLVFTADFHGDLDEFLRGFWTHAEAFIKKVWHQCLDFERVSDAASFVQYVKRCQVTTTFPFNGSTDDPLAEQLKALYLKQEFSKFVYEHQGLPAAELQAAFKQFLARVEPENVERPTWRAGASDLEAAVVP